MPDPSTTTVLDVLEARLRQLGVQRVYGLELGGFEHVAVDDPDLACLLADADGRIGHHDGSGRLGAAHLSGPILHLSSEPGGTAPLQTIGSVDDLLEALSDPAGIELPGTTALHLDLDLSEPVGSDVAAPERERHPVLTLDPSLAGLSLVCVVGPGVVRANALQQLESFTRTAGIGVLNSWGAKGVERWDSAHHFGTIGLQADDVRLAGLGDADVVIASGLDPAELGVDGLGSWSVQQVPPRQLQALCHGWERVRTTPVRPPLYDRLARVVTPLYESESVPLSPARAALHLSGALPERGLAVADPGPAGFWIARTFPTSIPGSVCVPATRSEGFAAAAALVCALEQRPVLAVTDQGRGAEGLDEMTDAVLELAISLGVPVALQLWGDQGRLDSTTAHVELLAELLDTETVRLVDVPVDLSVTEQLEAVAGPLVAW